MKDMNLAKLTAADLPLFNGVTSDLFPGVDVPHLDYSIVWHQQRASFRMSCVSPPPPPASSHSVMIVGHSGSGKTVTWQMLRNTLSRLKKENAGPQYQVVKVHILTLMCTE